MAKKLTKKKKIVLISVLSVVGAILIAASVIVGLLFRPANIPVREDLGFETVCYELPSDRDPTSHTGIENIGYMNWRLQHQNYWYSMADVYVDNSTDDQHVTTYKQYYEGVLVSTDISRSNLINSAVQYCQVRGLDVVLFRNSSGGKSSFNGINTPWSTGKPGGHTLSEYKVKKGLPPLEFSVYILNENTVKECSDVIDNGDGTYTQTFILNYKSEPAENDATYWYKTEMAYKANGMMKEDPQFSSVAITYTFDSTWQVISSHNKEVYKTITGVGPVGCTAEGDTYYTYGDKDLSYNPEYKKYYQNYMSDYEAPAEKNITAALCLAEAFGGVLTGESKLSLDLTVDGQPYSGVVQLNIDTMDIRVDLGTVKVYLREEDEEQYLYIAYGDGVKIKLALSDLTAKKDTPSPLLDEQTSDKPADPEPALLDKLLEALGDEERFYLSDDKKKATLSPTLDIGELFKVKNLDLKLDLSFTFDITEEGEITLDKVTATTNFVGSDIGVELRFTQNEVAALTAAQAAEYIALDIEGLTSLFSAEALSIDLGYSGYGVEVSGVATVNLKKFAIMADLTAVLDGDENAAKQISIIYANGQLYIAMNTVGEQPVAFKANPEEAVELVTGLLGINLPESSGEKANTLTTVLQLIEKIGADKLLNALLSEDGLSSVLTLSYDGEAVLTVDGTQLLASFGVTFELGEVKVTIGKNGTLSLGALGLGATLSACEAFTFDDSDYKDATDLLVIVRKVMAIIDAQQLSLGATVQIDAVTLVINNIAIDWSDGIDIKAYITLKYAEGEDEDKEEFVQDIYLSYGKTGVALYYDCICVQIDNKDIETFIGSIMQLVDLFGTSNGKGDNAGDILGMITGLIGGEKVEFDVLGLINQIAILASEEGNLTVAYGDVALELALNDGEISLGVSYDTGDTQISAGLALLEYTEVILPANCTVFNAAELLPLLNNVIQIAENKGLTVSGQMSLDLGSTEVKLTLYGLSVSWADGIAVQVDARLDVNGSKHDFYAEYSAKTGNLKLVYGALDSGVGVDINLKDDVSTLEGGLVKLYNRIAGIVNTMVEGDDVLPTVGSLGELMDLVSAGKGAVEDVAELAAVLEESTESEEEQQLTLVGILKSLKLSYCDGRLGATVMGINLSVWHDQTGTTLGVQTDGVSLELSKLQIVATYYTDFGINVVDALSAEDIVELLDYVAGTLELAAKDTINIAMSGAVTSKEEIYEDVGGIKYNFTAGFEYVQGTGYPVHIDTVKPDVWVAPDMYVHLYAYMESTLPEVDDSVVFSIYIFDGAMQTDSKGNTKGNSFTSGDNELDVYMSISCFPNGHAKSEPVKIYAPMSEIMTVLSAGLALVDIGSISVEALPQLNGIIQSIGATLDTLLVNRYFADTRDQFVSLGKGLLESFIGGNISDLLNNLINGLFGSEEEAPSEQEQVIPDEPAAIDLDDGGFMRERHGLIDRFRVNYNKNETGEVTGSEVVINVGSTEATVAQERYTYEKTAVGEDGEEYTEQLTGTRLTKLTVDESYYNETDALVNLNIDFSYNGVKKATPADLAGYMSILGVDKLVTTLVNSVTHKVPVEVAPEDLISGEEGAERKTYLLNEVFYVNGAIDVSGTLKIIFNFNITSLKINIDAFSVTIDEDGEVSFNVRISYKKASVSVLFTTIDLISADGVTDMSIRGDMIYIKRVSGGQTIYRAMPVSGFTNDILNQLGFILNLGSTITDMFAGTSGSTTAAVEEKQDYGTQLKKYLSSYSYNAASNVWSIAINGAGLLGDSSIISLSDIEVDIAAGEGAHGLVIKQLSFGTKLNILGGLLSLTVDKSKNSLNFVNPQDIWPDTDTQNAYNELVAGDPGDVVLNALKMTDDAQILAEIDWDRLEAETGGQYIELIIENGEITSDTKLQEITVNYYVKTGIADDAGEQFVAKLTQSNVLVNTVTRSIYSTLHCPDMSAYELEDYSFIWLDPVYNESTGEYKVVARYVRTELKVNYYSSVKFGGSVASTYTEGYAGQVYEKSVFFLDLSYGRPGSIAAAGSKFMGWAYRNGDGSWIIVEDLRTIQNLGYLKSIELHSIWINQLELNDSGISASGSLFKGFKADVYVTFSVLLYCRTDLIQYFTLEGSYTVTGSKSLSSDTGNGTFNPSNDNGVFACNNVGKQLSTSVSQYSSVSIEVSFNLKFNGAILGKTVSGAVSKEL